MEALTVSRREKRTGGKTLYGWYLTELMGRKRVANQGELARIMTKAGHVVSQSQISKIMRGEPQADASFGTALARALHLSEEEREEQAYLLTYGQVRESRLSSANMERMRDYRSRVREMEEQENSEHEREGGKL